MRNLQYFLGVAETGSFSKASALLSVTQPTLSRQIRGLEADLGISLLHRDGRGISLTPAGSVLRGYAQTIVGQLQCAKNELATLQNEPRGSVTLGVPPTVSVVLLPLLVPQLRASYPRVNLRVLESMSGELNEWLVKGRIDVAILAQTPATRQRHGEVIATEDLYLIGPSKPNHAVDAAECQLAELARYPLMLPSAANGIRVAVQSAAGENAIELKIILECDSVPSLIRLAQDGIGYSILPRYVVTREVELGLVSARKIINPPIQRTLLLATSNPKALTPATLIVVESIRRGVGTLIRSKSWIREPARVVHESKLPSL